MAVVKFRNPRGNNDFFDEEPAKEQYLPASQSAAEEEYSRDEGEGSQGSTFRLIIRALISIAVMSAIVILIVKQSQNRSFTSADYSRIGELSSQENTEWRHLGNNIFSYSKDGASCMSYSGDLIWSITYEMQQPIVQISGNVAAIADYNGSQIQIVNSESVLGKVSTNLPIHDIAVSENGEVAAILNDTDITWIYLYNNEGGTIASFRTTMQQSGYPVAVSISPSGELVCVSHLTIGSTSVNSSIAFHNFGSVGPNAVDNNVGGFNYEDEVFPFIRFMNNGTLAAVSDARIAFFHGRQIPESGEEYLFEDREVDGVYYSDNYIGLLFSDAQDGTAHTLRVFDTSGDEVGDVGIDLDFTDLQICGERVIANNSQQIEIYSVTGNRRYHGDFDMDIRAVIPSENSTAKFTVITDDSIEQMVLE